MRCVYAFTSERVETHFHYTVTRLISYSVLPSHVCEGSSRDQRRHRSRFSFVCSMCNEIYCPRAPSVCRSSVTTGDSRHLVFLLKKIKQCSAVQALPCFAKPATGKTLLTLPSRRYYISLRLSLAITPFPSEYYTEVVEKESFESTIE